MSTPNAPCEAADASTSNWRSVHCAQIPNWDPTILGSVDGLLEVQAVVSAEKEDVWYECVWRDEMSRRLAEGSGGLTASGLEPSHARQTVRSLYKLTPRTTSRWLSPAFYLTIVAGLVALVGHLTVATDVYQYLWGGVEANLLIEAEEAVKPRAVHVPFKIGVMIKNSKRTGRLWVESVLGNEIPELKISPLNPAGRVSIEPGKTEKFDFLVQSAKHGKSVEITFKVLLSSGSWRGRVPKELKASIDIWEARDTDPEIKFVDAAFPQTPRFEVVLRNGEANPEITLEFELPPDATEFAFATPRNVSEARQLSSPRQTDATTNVVRRVILVEPESLKEIRVPFQFRTSIGRSNEEWKKKIGIQVHLD